MSTKNNALLQLFILFLLFIIGCQQGNAMFPSSNSTVTADSNTTINKDEDQSGMSEKIDELKNKIDEMKKQNEELKNEMEKMKVELKTELKEMKKLMKKLEEIFGLKEEDAKYTTKTQLQMQIEEKMKNNNLNEADCGPNLKLKIFPLDSIILKYSRLNSSKDISNSPFVFRGSNSGYSTIRTISPISTYNFHDKKPSIAGYYEVQILNTGSTPIFDVSIAIGYCDQHFPLEESCLGEEKNAIGIMRTNRIWLDGYLTKFKNINKSFKKEDFAGIGIIHKPNWKIECFATWNGKLLGKVELPEKFINIELFPAVGLLENDDKISLNFGKHDWRFKEFEQLLD